MTEEFLKKVDQINEQLRSFGKQAIQEIKMVARNKDGSIMRDANGNEKVIGRVMYGYRPQYVFDAVNEIIGTEHWRYEIASKEIFGKQAVVEVKLFIRINDEWLCKGSQTGQMNIIKDNVGDAYKGAVTDALQKCFSLVSVGQDAYRGLLKEVYFGKSTKRPPANHKQPPKTQSQLPRQQSQPPVTKPSVSSKSSPPNIELPPGLPELAGIEWKLGNGIVFAEGNTYNHKGNIKSLGFRWDGEGKCWYKELSELAAA